MEATAADTSAAHTTWPVTCVTALFDIGRGAVDGRSFVKYLQWLRATLECVVAPVVVFLDADATPRGWEDGVVAQRAAAGLPTRVVRQHWRDTPRAADESTVAAIQASDAFVRRLPHPRDITNRLPGYPCLIFSKFAWVASVCEANPWHSERFAWVDAGTSRFWRRPPWRYVPRVLPRDDARFVMQVRRALVHPAAGHARRLDAAAFIGTNECLVQATLMSAPADTWRRVATAVDAVWRHDMLAAGAVDTEQCALALAYQRLPHGTFHAVVEDERPGAGFVDAVTRVLWDAQPPSPASTAHVLPHHHHHRHTAASPATPLAAHPTTTTTAAAAGADACIVVTSSSHALPITTARHRGQRAWVRPQLVHTNVAL